MPTFRQTVLEIKGDLPADKNILISFLKSYLYSPRFRLLLNYRIGKYFYHKRNFVLRQVGIYYKSRMIVKRHCDISYNALLGKNIRFPHPLGIVIGDRVIIEDNVMIFQHVTLGSHGKKGDIQKQYPTIKTGAKIFAGAKIIGDVTLGENAIVGANCVVNIDVPADAVAVGIPCRLISNI